MENQGSIVTLANELLKQYKDYDLSSQDKEETNNRYINNLIKSKLGGISDKWFVEYSVLATTIDPLRTNENAGRLRCYSFIQGNPTFKDKIEKYISPIISVLKDKAKNNNWWFHNPETFLAPTEIYPYISLTSNHSIDTNIVGKIMELAEKMEEEDEYRNKYKGDNSFFFSSMEYSRSFGDILSFSKEVCQNVENEQNKDITSSLIRHYHQGVEEARLYYDEFVADEGETFAYLTFPIIAAPARSVTPNIYRKTFGDDFLIGRYQGLGHCFVYFNIKAPDKFKVEDYKKDVESLFKIINETLHNFAFNYTFNLGLLLQDKVKKEAEKAAKAAIMSRNMSHNIGSHVMAYLKQHLSSVTNILQDNILSDFISSSSFSELLNKIEQAKENQDTSVKFIKEMSTEEGSLALPFLVGLGNFISYLQERQDFIATIATDYIPYYSTVNFKDFVYDEINPDKRYLRHKDRKNLQPDNILLGNIARSEGLGRTISPTEKENGKLSDIVIKFRKFDGNPVANESNVVLSGRQDAYDDLEFMRQIDVSLPGGMVGRQAIFSMLENIIRNAAKHGNWRIQGKLELTLDFIDKDAVREYGELIERKFELEINESKLTDDQKNEYDSITKKLEERDKDAAQIEDFDSDPLGGRDTHKSLMRVLWQFYSKSLDADDLYFVTITDNINISEPAIYKLREALTEGYIDSESRMIESNKGIKEIRISAAWLRGAKNEDEYYNEVPKNDTIAQTEKKAPLLYIRQHNRNLQYIFCLLIPKRVAVVSDSFDKAIKLNDKAKKRLAKLYWKVFTPSEYIEENNKSYNFVLCDGEGCYNMIRPYSSSRIVQTSKIIDINRDELLKSIHDGITQKECHRIESCLYQYFSNCETGKDFICVDDKKAYARYVNKPTTTQYKWVKETGKFLRSQGNEQKEIDIDDNNLFDGLALIPEHDYCKNGNVIITDGGGFGKYVYRTHHDMNDEFRRFMGELRNNFIGCQFVESVTGNSSTDRLVRNDSFDDKWFYSHLRATKQQVAIFDERLFAKLYGLEEVDFTRANAASGTLDEMKKEYAVKFGANFAKEINKCESIDELNKLVSSNNALKRKLYESEADAKSRNVSVYYQKGIYVYTFVRNPQNKNTYGMYGLQLFPDRTDILDGIENAYHAKTVKLVDLSWEDSSLKITPELSTKYPAKCFDYISIHQGLLDKLYEAFGIKDNENAKVELTRKLYLFLKSGNQNIMNVSQNTGVSTQKEAHLFMPGMMVHSGRSKPNKKDMPQLLPFIQYAAIEHAALDCKYSLVELLDNARYEK